MKRSKPAPGDVRKLMGVRIPDALRERLERAAGANNRTLSSEVEGRLARSFTPMTSWEVGL